MTPISFVFLCSSNYILFVSFVSFHFVKILVQKNCEKNRPFIVFLDV